MRDESWEEAVTEFRAAIRFDPMMVMAHYGLGQCRMALKEYPEAVKAFLACREAHHTLAGMQHANRELSDQRRDDEIRDLRDSIRLFQSGGAKSASPQNMVLKLESRLQQLENERRKGVTPDQTPAEFSLALGSAYFRSGKLEDAEREYREAIKVNPKMGEAHNNLAVVFMLTGLFEEAEVEVKAAEKAGFPVNPRFKDDLKKRKAEAEKR
jgi:superkiller protein 3